MPGRRQKDLAIAIRVTTGQVAIGLERDPPEGVEGRTAVCETRAGRAGRVGDLGEPFRGRVEEEYFVIAIGVAACQVAR